MTKMPKAINTANTETIPTPITQVSSEDFRNMSHICRVIDEIMRCPEARQMLFRAAKIANPDRRIPELDGPLQ